MKMQLNSKVSITAMKTKHTTLTKVTKKVLYIT